MADLNAMAAVYRQQCNRIVNGQCQMRKCLVRGGWVPGQPVDYDVATCLERDTAMALERLATIEGK